MLRQSRDWIWIVLNSFSSGKRASGRSSRPGSAPRLEPLEDRMLLIAGQLDPTFGAGGKVLTDFSSTVMGPANALVLQPDGKIVVAGGAFVLVRYNSDGNLDPNFGTAGKVTGN